jgi:hypothetical protein
MGQASVSLGSRWERHSLTTGLRCNLSIATPRGVGLEIGQY